MNKKTDYKKIKQIVKQFGIEESVKELTRILIKESGGMMWYKNKKGKYLWCNKEMSENLYGIPPEDVKGYTDEELAQKYWDVNNIPYGTMCNKTDKFTRDKKRGCIFLFFAILNDRDMTKYVIKTPIKTDDGKVIGTIGVALNGISFDDAKQIIQDRIENNEEYNMITQGYYYLGSTGEINGE